MINQICTLVDEYLKKNGDYYFWFYFLHSTEMFFKLAERVSNVLKKESFIVQYPLFLFNHCIPKVVFLLSVSKPRTIPVKRSTNNWEITSVHHHHHGWVLNPTPWPLASLNLNNIFID